MATFLPTWNPEKWSWEDLDDEIATLSESGAVEGQWSTGNTKHKIAEGDRFFMLRQGPEPRGIMASGVFTSGVFQEGHYTEPGKTANYAAIRFDVLVNPDRSPRKLIPLDRLVEKFDADFQFVGVAASGQELPADVAAGIERLWSALHH